MYPSEVLLAMKKLWRDSVAQRGEFYVAGEDVLGDKMMYCSNFALMRQTMLENDIMEAWSMNAVFHASAGGDQGMAYARRILKNRLKGLSSDQFSRLRAEVERAFLTQCVAAGYFDRKGRL